MRKKLLAALVMVIGLSAVLSACLKNKNDVQQTCNYNPCGYKAPDTEIQAVKHYLDSMGITATQHCSGFFYKIDTLGSGTAPTACSAVAVTYKGTLTNGTVFDQSKSGQAFVTYLANVIPGWTNGIPLIKTGGTIHLYIPPSLGYGSQDNGAIPGNSILIFDVSLIAVQ